MYLCTNSLQKKYVDIIYILKLKPSKPIYMNYKRTRHIYSSILHIYVNIIKRGVVGRRRVRNNGKNYFFEGFVFGKTLVK